MFEEFHDQGPKPLINGETLPAGQTGMQDISDVLDMLFMHDNTPPFIAKRLIQHMVKSNPSPAYVRRVALTFVDNGRGVRGDMEAVIRSILVDPEAIECSWIDDPTTGKLIQPLERFLNLFLAFDVETPSGKYYMNDISFLDERLEQSFLNSSTVFNFFTPFYAESSLVAPQGLVSPEFQILHSSSSIHYANLIENSIKRFPFTNFTGVDPNQGKIVRNDDDRPVLDLSDEIALYETEGAHAMIDRLDLILCRGQLSLEIKDIIAGAITQYESQLGSYTSLRAVQDALFFILTSPQYIIQK